MYVDLDGDYVRVGKNGNCKTEICQGAGKLSFFGATATYSQQSVTGARNNPEAALKNLLIALARFGLIVDNTTAP